MVCYADVILNGDDREDDEYILDLDTIPSNNFCAPSGTNLMINYLWLVLCVSYSSILMLKIFMFFLKMFHIALTLKIFILKGMECEVFTFEQQLISELIKKPTQAIPSLYERVRYC